MKPFTRTYVLILTLALCSPAVSFGHAGHADAPGEGDGPGSGPIVITAEAKQNLRLEIVEADLRTLDKTLSIIGQIESIPGQSGAVSSRISGRVTKLYANEGQPVKKGDAIVEIESRQLGDPPPRVELFAPISGLIMDRHVVIGDSVEPNEHLVEIGDISEVYAAGYLFEGQVAKVKLGQKVRVRVESFPDRTFEGTVDLISGSLDPDTRTLKVWTRIKNPELLLKPNMRAHLSVVTAQADYVITIPHSAVLGEFGQYFVFVQSDTDELEFERVPVVLGMKDDRYHEVVGGIFPSDKVVTTGNYQLQYVTTRKEEKDDGEEGHDHPDESSGSDSPLQMTGIVLGILLFLNLLVMLLRRRGANRPNNSTIFK